MKTVNVIIMEGALALSANASFAGDAEAGKTTFIGKVCAGCHGAAGATQIPDTPKLTGEDAASIKQALCDFKSGTRSSPAMNNMPSMLKDEGIDDIAAYICRQ